MLPSITYPVRRLCEDSFLRGYAAEVVASMETGLGAPSLSFDCILPAFSRIESQVIFLKLVLSSKQGC